MSRTKIGSHLNDTTRLRMRGRDTLGEIIGTMTFTEGFYFIVTGREPTPAQARVLDAALLILMDHGLTPSAIVARLVADSNPEDIQIPLAAGALMVGNKFAGTMVGTGRILSEGMEFKGDKKAWAVDVVRQYRESGRRIPGFGHPYYQPVDPRAERLFSVARDAGVEGTYIELLNTLHEAVNAGAKRTITLNVTGALGAVLHEIGFPLEAMRAVAVVGRCAGLVAHVEEERKSPISQDIYTFSESIEYDE
ncbi:citryl-CoA lyase [Cupriavidus necator]|uniref:citrate synthase (unknown stereospecificity) n=1 Tax=Cupriavidus pinatubonensis (strain JMP 134 / LMG 1197) TaxID=264198 RepID=Q46MK6_CUPPJ|nr:citryl-CoA lyase [Cupriavidus necator]